MKILSIDTSCDDTSVAITNNQEILINCVSSQIEIHKKTGGVVPIDAARAHDIKIDPLINYALKRVKISCTDLDAIAVTYGPGLAPALEVGIKKAKQLATDYKIPLIPVNHMAGHIYANWHKKSQQFPLIALLVSGGHTEIVYMKNHFDFQIIGETLDDACGECFDKVGRMLGLGYPAGPIIEKFAKEGDKDAYVLPRPMHNTNDLNVSYSGLKTASFRLIKSLADNALIDKAPSGSDIYDLNKKQICDVCASFQQAAFETILIKLEQALSQYSIKTIILGGGVVKNKILRKKARNIAKKNNILFSYPEEKLINDNAAMIGLVAYFQQQYTKKILKNNIEISELERVPGLRL